MVRLQARAPPLLFEALDLLASVDHSHDSTVAACHEEVTIGRKDKTMRVLFGPMCFGLWARVVRAESPSSECVTKDFFARINVKEGGVAVALIANS